MSTPKEEVRYFYEDEVYRIKRNGVVQFGMVIENSEFASSDESDSQRDPDEELAPGRIRVAWHPNGEEEIVKEKLVGLADRSLMPGDVVRRLILGKDTQRGYCRQVAVRASVEIVGTQQVVFDVDSKDLVPLEEFTADVAVALGSWVGMIKHIDSVITLKLPDGSICQMSDRDACDLEDMTDKRDEDCEFKRYDYYPGQLLSGHHSFFNKGTFTYCSEELKNLKNTRCAIKAIVEKVEAVSVTVNWQCQAYESKQDCVLSDLSTSQPPNIIKDAQLEKLKMLNVFEPCTLQIGDRNYYTLKTEDIIMLKEEWRKLEKESYLKVNDKKKSHQKMASDVIKKRPDIEDSSEDESDTEVPVKSTAKSSKPSVTASTLSKKKKLKRSRKNSDRANVTTSLVDLKPGDKVIVETLCTKSEATVVWQDGSIEENISSRELYPIHALDDQEFFPGDFVIGASLSAPFDPHAYGVVQHVDHLGRVCSVKWFRTYTTGNDPHPLFVSSSLEPVYDLKDHPDFKYRPGSIVIRVANFTDMMDCTGGQVLDNYPSGQVMVWWANSTTSACWPQDLYKIGEYDSDDGELWDDDLDSDDDNVSGGSWETESEHSVIQSENEGEDQSLNLRSRLAASIERSRIAMTKLENVFNEPSNPHTNVIKQLLDVYKDCRNLDSLLNTEFFDEVHFEDLVSKVQKKSKNSGTQQAVQDQMQRLFTEESSEDKKTSESSDELNQICGRLCALIKTQLGKSHDEVMLRYGGQAANFTADDLTQSPGEEDIDLQDLMRKLSSNDEPNPDAPKGEPEVQVQPGLYKTKGGNVSNYDISNALYGKQPEEQDSEVFEEDADDKIGEFSMIESAPASHKFKLSVFQPNDPKNFIKFVRKEVKLLRTSLPSGIHVKGFEDRMDLYSVMIEGPARTPYEDGLFFFDFQLSADYPRAPPICHYHSYVSDRLNPNLYEDGKVCVSLLGTWSGKGTETWTPNSNLLQLLVSIQGLILVSEPYFNEAGYERQKGTQQGCENSRMYNEMVVLKLVQAMTRLALNPPEAFKDHVLQHFQNNAQRLIERVDNWRQISLAAMNCSSSTTPEDDISLKGPESFTQASEKMPEFPLVPASKGFCLSLDKSVEALKSALKAQNISFCD